MSYDVPAIIALAKACAPEIATEAIVPLVLTESGGEPLQINVNKGPRVRARTVPEGAALVRRYIAAGYTVDVGLAQINSANFTRLGVTIESVFEPCNNLRLASVSLPAAPAMGRSSCSDASTVRVRICAIQALRVWPWAAATRSISAIRSSLSRRLITTFKAPCSGAIEPMYYIGARWHILPSLIIDPPSYKNQLDGVKSLQTRSGLYCRGYCKHMDA